MKYEQRNIAKNLSYTINRKISLTLEKFLPGSRTNNLNYKGPYSQTMFIGLINAG